MARRDDLAILAKRVQVPFITINQIINYMDANGIDAAADLTKVNAQWNQSSNKIIKNIDG